MCAQRDDDGGRADADLDRVLARLNARIATHVAAHGSRHTFGTYVDAALSRVVLETDAPPDVVDALLADDRGSRRVIVRRASISDTTPGTP